MADVDIRIDSDDSTNENENEGSKVLKTARLRKSCEPCRTQKARCIPTKGSELCQRYVGSPVANIII